MCPSCRILLDASFTSLLSSKSFCCYHGVTMLCIHLSPFHWLLLSSPRFMSILSSSVHYLPSFMSMLLSFPSCCLPSPLLFRILLWISTPPHYVPLPPLLPSPSSPPFFFSRPQHWLTELEIFAMIFAAAVHDYEHTGTTNNFHIQTR